MRVLVTSVPGFGHFGPMVPVARALAAAGHGVAVATSADFHPVVAGAGLQAMAAGLSEEAVVARRRELWPETEGRPPREWAVRMFARIAAPAMLADLDAIVAGWRPALVVHDEGELAGPVAAAAAGVPWVTHGWGSPLRRPGELASLADDVDDLWTSHGLVAPAAGGLYEHAVIDPSPPALAGDAARVPHRMPVRFEPFRHGAGRANVPGGTDRPLAYVSFGTVPMYAAAPPLVERVTSVLVDEGFDVLLTAPEAPPGTHTSRVRVEPFVSLPAVLPRCSLVVCHGGAGTTLAALASGLPVLLLPRGAPSQARMAEACRRAGAAEVVEEGDDGRAALVAAVRRLATDPRYQAAARSIAAEIAAMPAAPSVVPALEALAGRA